MGVVQGGFYDLVKKGQLSIAVILLITSDFIVPKPSKDKVLLPPGLALCHLNSDPQKHALSSL